MNNEWKRVQGLFHAAVSLDTDERAVYLAEECPGNTNLRDEVESLVVASRERGDLLEEPAFGLGMQVLSSTASTIELAPHQSIGSYTVSDVLGKGGMGKVYLAEDTQLGRKVALKFLSSSLAGDQWAKKQLVKEARAAAMLDHPNICAVYGLEEADGHCFIVMQYVDGQGLDALMRERQLTLDEIVGLSVQIVSALSEAQAHGIIHRDIKPQNIMVTPAGHLKVLDFGLAKLVRQEQEVSVGSAPREPWHQGSQLGLIPGTVSYMSPEQLGGERLDFRTDVFSFGTILYEMISGENPFARETKAETISAILSYQPPSPKRTLKIPKELDRILRKCLEKEKEERYQSAEELSLDLLGLQNGLTKRKPSSYRFDARTAYVLALCLLLIGATGFVYRYVTRPRRLAVLPIFNQSGNEDLEFLVEGLPESIINRLSPLANLKVRALTTVAGYKWQGTDPQRVGQDLNVDAILEGTIAGTGESRELRESLISTSDGSPIWSESYPISSDGFLVVEDEISRKVTSSLELWSKGDQNRLTASHSTVSPQADREYMEGRNAWRKRDLANIEGAIKHFNAATTLDPNYGRAYAGLADCYVLQSLPAFGRTDPNEAMKKAEYAAQRALEIDDSLAEAHTSLGVVNLRYYWNWSLAESEFKRSIEIDPQCASAHYWYSQLLAINSRHEESIAQSEASKNLEPISAPAVMNYCRSFYYARQYGKAADCLDNLVKEQPGATNVQYLLGLVYIQQHMIREAAETFEKIYAADKAVGGAPLGYVYGISGKTTEARRILAEMQELSRQLRSDRSYIAPQELAMIHLGLGQKEEAIRLLKKAADEHFAPVTYIMADALFDGLRSEPGFDDIVRTLNLTPPRR